MAKRMKRDRSKVSVAAVEMSAASENIEAEPKTSAAMQDAPQTAISTTKKLAEPKVNEWGYAVGIAATSENLKARIAHLEGHLAAGTWEGAMAAKARQLLALARTDLRRAEAKGK